MALASSSRSRTLPARRLWRPRSTAKSRTRSSVVMATYMAAFAVESESEGGHRGSKVMDAMGGTHRVDTDDAVDDDDDRSVCLSALCIGALLRVYRRFISCHRFLFYISKQKKSSSHFSKKFQKSLKKSENSKSLFVIAMYGVLGARLIGVGSRDVLLLVCACALPL